MVGLITGTLIGLSKYRNINIIPEIAQRNRLALIHEFKMFLKERPKVRKYARYMVVTSGPRFPIKEFPDRLELFNKLIGRYLEKCKRAGIECVLVSIEFTVDAEDGNSINLHANIVTAPKKAFGAKGWTEWLERTRSHFGETMIHDSGRIREPDEIIKYVCKYNEIVGLPGKETAFIAKTLHKKQLVRPLSSFKEWRKKLRDDGQKIRFDHVEKDIVRCQVAKRKNVPDDEMTLDEIREDILATNREADRQERTRQLSRMGKLHHRDDQPKDPIENQILCRTLPQSRASLLAEPFVVVVNFNCSPRTQNGRDGLEAIENRRRHHFKLLAEDGFTVDELNDRAAGSSILDTLTIIPNQLSKSFFELSRKRQIKLQRLLGLSDFAPDDTDYQRYVGDAARDVLAQHYPKNRHTWASGLADMAQLLREGAEAQDWFIEGVEVRRTIDTDYADYQRRFASLDHLPVDEYEDMIPY